MDKDPIKKFEGQIEQQGKRLSQAFRDVRTRSKSNNEDHDHGSNKV
jgi:hypothetical protein